MNNRNHAKVHRLHFTNKAEPVSADDIAKVKADGLAQFQNQYQHQHQQQQHTFAHPALFSSSSLTLGISIRNSVIDSSICRAWRNHGACLRGNECGFAHPDNLRAVANNLFLHVPSFSSSATQPRPLAANFRQQICTDDDDDAQQLPPKSFRSFDELYDDDADVEHPLRQLPDSDITASFLPPNTSTTQIYTVGAASSGPLLFQHQQPQHNHQSDVFLFTDNVVNKFHAPAPRLNTHITKTQNYDRDVDDDDGRLRFGFSSSPPNNTPTPIRGADEIIEHPSVSSIASNTTTVAGLPSSSRRDRLLLFTDVSSPIPAPTTTTTPPPPAFTAQQPSVCLTVQHDARSDQIHHQFQQAPQHQQQQTKSWTDHFHFPQQNQQQQPLIHVNIHRKLPFAARNNNVQQQHSQQMQLTDTVGRRCRDGDDVENDSSRTPPANSADELQRLRNRHNNNIDTNPQNSNFVGGFFVTASQLVPPSFSWTSSAHPLPPPSYARFRTERDHQGQHQQRQTPTMWGLPNQQQLPR